MMRGQIACVAVLCVLGMGTAPAENDDRTSTPEKRIAWANSPDVLAGLKAVNLHLAIRGGVKSAPPAESALRTKIEKRLRQSGLIVLTNDEAASEEVPIMLTVIIDCQEIEARGDGHRLACEGVVYLVRVMLDDIVVPYRDDESVILGATTWRRHRFGFAEKNELPAKQMNDALALTDAFCLDLVEANRPSAAP